LALLLLDLWQREPVCLMAVRKQRERKELVVLISPSRTHSNNITYSH
jgi:hypothetical protein